MHLSRVQFVSEHLPRCGVIDKLGNFKVPLFRLSGSELGSVIKNASRGCIKK